MNLLDLPEDILKEIDIHVEFLKQKEKILKRKQKEEQQDKEAEEYREQVRHEYIQSMMERINLAQHQMEYRSNRITYGSFF
jgi:adenylate kinase